MRNGFDGLSGLVSNEWGRKPTDGSVFVFINKPCTQIKLLHWERGGLVLYSKRLEQGRFTRPKQQPSNGEISWPELVLMLEGISYSSLKKKKRFELKKEY